MLHRFSAASLLAVISCALPALALAGTLEQIRKSGEIRIGYRTDAPPLAFNDASGQARQAIPSTCASASRPP